MIYSLETVRESVYDPNTANIFVLVSIFAADKLITPGFLLTHVIGIMRLHFVRHLVAWDYWSYNCSAYLVIFSITKKDLKGMECCDASSGYFSAET